MSTGSSNSNIHNYVKLRNDEFFARSAAAVKHIESGATATEQEFHDVVRELLVCALIYFLLYAIAYCVIRYLRRNTEVDDYALDYEDAIADRVALWLCTFTLATAFGAILLLPMSIVAVEIIRALPHSFYWKWLNSSLLYGLWNSVFLFSNLSLFVFLPFAHLFTESIGLPGSKRGIKSRLLETGLLLFLMTFCVIGMSFVASAIFDADNAQSQSFLNIRNYHLPFLYSCISFIGVLFLLICTPLGFAGIFTLISNLIMKSTFRADLNEDLEIAEFEHTCLVQRIEDLRHSNINAITSNPSGSSATIRNYEIHHASFKQKLQDTKALIRKLKNESNRSTIFRSLGYPFMMLFLLLLNALGVFIVAKNTFFVLFGHLPTNSKFSLEPSQILNRINANSENGTDTSTTYSYGTVQIGFEIILILYFMIASLVGFYNMPFFSKVLPAYKATTMRKILLNCSILLLFSSALPVASKILGLTRFDLLGHFGDLHWLANAHVILVYNTAFALGTGICFVTKFTATFRSELYKRVLILFRNALLNKSMPPTAAVLINSPAKAD